MINIEIITVFFIVWWNCHRLFIEWEYNSFFLNSEYNYWIVILVFVLYLIMQNIVSGYTISLNLLFILLYFILQVSRIIVFYFIYEIVFVFIIFVIIVLGYRYERLRALYLIIFYSFVFSRPCLIIILLIDKRYLIKEWIEWGRVLLWFLVASFIVKFPIFGFHYWLPVAHVEASTLGSMLLAGILLKLGGIGLYYLVIMWGIIVKFHWLIVSVLLVIIFIINLRDLKIMIAYSSIAHITLVFYVINLGSIVGKKGRLIIIFYHGYVSPLIFWLVGIYGWWKTRSLIVIKYIRVSSIFIMIIFIVIIINIRFPPFIGFLREVLILKRIVQVEWLLYLARIGVLLSCYYNIYLMWAFVNSQGWVIKLMFNQLELYLFLLWVIFLNF